MIKINLLPKKEITQWVAFAEQGILALLIVIALILGMTGWTVYLRGEVRDLEVKIAATKAELEELKKNEAKIEEMKKTEAVIQKRIDVIKRLEKRKTGQVTVLDAVASTIPEKAWLTDLQSSGSMLTLRGVAIDNETIAVFMTNLERSGQFENIELQVAKEKRIQDFMFKEFSLTCVVKVMKEIIADASQADSTDPKKSTPAQ